MSDPSVNEMSDEQMRVKTAELLGLSILPKSAWVYKSWKKGPEPSFAGKSGPCIIRDYTNDLNAAAEMEKTLTDKRIYIETLTAIMKPGEWTVCATARQRCIAFLKTKGAK